jgi:hypothetical protein
MDMVSLVLRTNNLLEHLALESLITDLEYDLNARACLSREMATYSSDENRAFVVIFGQQAAEMLVAIQELFPDATNVNTHHPSLLSLPRFAPMNIVRKVHLQTLPPSVLQAA